MCISETNPTPPSDHREGERGTAILSVLGIILMLSAFLIGAARQVTQDVDAATRYRWRQQAFYVAESGAQYGQAQLIADSSWSGLAAPGKNVQEGSFYVSVSRVDAAGVALPANQKRIISTGTVYTAVAQVSQTLQFN
jgi:Tfp pilus assembly protein PilX